MSYAVIVSMTSRGVVAVGVVLAGLLAVRACRAKPARGIRIATFNIEEFPKNDRQIAGAFRLIAQLHADAVAVQEIRSPVAFAAAARERLGARWQFASANVTPNGAPEPISMGVLFDADRFRLAAVRVHDATRIDGRGKPTVEVVLDRPGAPPLRLFVVHLKSGSAARELRAQQYRALAGILANARRSPGQIAVLGDFNSTEDADRTDLAGLAARAHLAWATEGLPCTAFWRRDGDCPTSRLDHVLTWAPARHVEVAGPCAESCAARDRCPTYRDEVSDHCPVIVDAPAQ